MDTEWEHERRMIHHQQRLANDLHICRESLNLWTLLGTLSLGANVLFLGLLVRYWL